MVEWREPPKRPPYNEVSKALHGNPNQWARVYQGVFEGDEDTVKYEKSKIRVKWAQAMERRCVQCKVTAASTGNVYEIYAIHLEDG